MSNKFKIIRKDNLLHDALKKYIKDSSLLFGLFPKNTDSYVSKKERLKKSGIYIRKGITYQQLKNILPSVPIFSRNKNLSNIMLKTENWNVKYLKWKNFNIIRNGMPYLRNHLILLHDKKVKRIPQDQFESSNFKTSISLLNDIALLVKLSKLHLYFNGTIGEHLKEFHCHLTTEKYNSIGSCSWSLVLPNNEKNINNIVFFIHEMFKQHKWGHNLKISPKYIKIRFTKRNARHRRFRPKSLPYDGSGTVPSHSINVVGGYGLERRRIMNKYYDTKEYKELKKRMNETYDSFCKSVLITPKRTLKEYKKLII